MHLPGTKHTSTEISEPMDARRIDDQPQPQALYNAGETNPGAVMDGDHGRRTHGLVHPHPDPNHVYQEGGNHPPGANEVHDPTRGVEAGQRPMNASTTLPGDPNVVVVEQKLPFKEQVKAYSKIHRGTLLRDHEQKETGKKILAGEIPPQ
ncbi:hypothetical protein M408DRAFT_14479 [Serendipita vermifera MAFF 305830]|uniref:Uncharacterized protein n=1 Tax=Serendipita vermifera MAFF 305830 TaxID=933852 RepID=A0A0C2XVF4_SERVB|nr:hypothetical protein M408DRAFT_14479 [Serendipita vermifera MAFF 305830]